MRLDNPIPTPQWMHPLTLLRTMWKRKVRFGCVAILLIAGVVVAVYRLPAIYKSDAVVLVDSQKIPDRYVSSSVNTEVGDRLATISQRILSSDKLKKIIRDFDLYSEDRKHMVEEEILEQIRKDIEIKVEKGWSGNRPGAFRISYRGPVPTVVAAVANRIANLYVDENLQARELQAEGTSEFLLNELDGAKKTLDQLEAAVSKYKLEHNGELPEQENALTTKIVSLQTQSQANQDAINRAQQSKVILENGLAFYEAAEATVAGATPEHAPSTPGRKTETEQVDPREEAIAALEARIDSLRARFTDSYPEMKTLKSELARLRSLPKPVVKANPQTAKDGDAKPHTESPGAAAETRARSAQQLETSSRISNIKAQLKLSTDELESRIAQQAGIQKEMAVVQARVDSLPVREQEMAGLLRDYEISKANYKSLLDKKISAQMATEMERRQKAERFTVVDPARVPEIPISPNRPLLIGLGTFLALVLSLAIAAGQDLKTGAILGEWELPAGVVVLGRVPRIVSEKQSGTDPVHPGRTSAEVGDARSARFWHLRSPMVRLRRSIRNV